MAKIKKLEKHGRKQVSKKVRRATAMVAKKVRRKPICKEVDFSKLETIPLIHTDGRGRDGLARFAKLEFGVSSQESRAVLQHRDREVNADILMTLKAMGG